MRRGATCAGTCRPSGKRTVRDVPGCDKSAETSARQIERRSVGDMRLDVIRPTIVVPLTIWLASGGTTKRRSRLITSPGCGASRLVIGAVIIDPVVGARPKYPLYQFASTAPL